MINKIIESISITLAGEFGSGYEIYREEKRQGLKEPCFFIACMNPTDKLFFWKRYFRQNQFCIHYFPQNELQGNAECCAVAERLFSCLEYLDVDGDPVMGTEMKYEITDGLLHFFVNYDMFVYKVAPAAVEMGEIEITGTAERRCNGKEKEP